MFKFKSEVYKRVPVRPRGKLVQETLDKYGKLLTWKHDGTDRILDVGSGVGDLIPGYIEPLMPSNYKQILGYDISEDMVKYANKTYGSERIKFEVVDVTSDLTKKIENMEKFEHAISTFALMWIPNLRKAISNISKFLSNDGDILLVIGARPALFDFHQEQIKLEKWGPMVSQYQPVWKPIFNEKLYEKQFKSYLVESGFQRIDITMETRAFNLDSRDDFNDFFNATNPVHEYLSEDQQKDMFEEFVKFNYNLNITNPLDETMDPFCSMQSVLLSGYASKQK